MEPQKWNCLTFEASIETDVEQIWVKAMDRIKERTNGLLDIRYLSGGVMATRCCSPPESSADLWLALLAKPTRSNASIARLRLRWLPL